jgi:hypothetical protein
MSLPTKIRGVSRPEWTDTLVWLPAVAEGRFVAVVDQDWRVSVDGDGSMVIAWHKGWPDRRQQFDTLAEALDSLDCRIDA